jgi:sugar phosphate isomerase/epimerase
MAKKKLSYREIMRLAEDYGVKDNVLFVSAADRYVGQVEMIRKIEDELRERGMIIEKVNTNGDTVPVANPMAQQLPKYNDTANKTLGVMLDIIGRLGTAAPAGDKLSEFLNE